MCCFLLRGIDFWCCAFLDLRLYALVVSLLLLCVGGSVCMTVLGESLFCRCVPCVFGEGYRVVCCGRWWDHGEGFGAIMLRFRSFCEILS